MFSWNTIRCDMKFGGEVGGVPASAVAWPIGEDAPPSTPDEKRMLLAKHLLDPAGCPPGMPVPAVPPFLADLTDGIRGGDWREAPIPVFGTDGARILPLLVGLLPEGAADHRVEHGILTDQAEKAARTALDAGGRGRHFAILSRGIVRKPSDVVDGASLGLPIALAARMLVEGGHLPAGLMATGAVETDGRVSGVGHVREKHVCAAEAAGMIRAEAAFLCPAANIGEIGDGPDAFGVESVDDAVAMARLSAPIRRSCRGWRERPETFFSWFGETDFAPDALPPLLDMARRRGWVEGLSPEALARALDHLHEAWHERGLRARKELAQEILELFPLPIARRLPPGAALFHLIQMRRTLLNSRAGNLEPEWKKLEDDCRGVRSLANEFLLRRAREWEEDLHNRCRFRPEDIRKEDENGLFWNEDLKEQYEFCRKRKRSDRFLGKCFGFLAQHMAYCRLPGEALEAAERSLEMFDRDDGKNRKRCHIYHVHIFLDLDDAGRAGESLERALQCEHAGKGLPADAPLAARVAVSTDEFVHAAFARLCRHRPELFDGDYALARLDSTPAKHPWHLWAHRCGRLLAAAGRPDAARACHERALAICADLIMAEAGPIFLAMSLPPLAGLRLLDPENAGILDRTEDILSRLRAACAAGELDADHFRILTDAPDAAAALDIVEREQARLFPFDYS